jgi:catechol 2,3-dioxygenase-like lactoylglutathione lyase family enzyme
MDVGHHGLGALTLFVDDLGATAQFYRDALGLEQIYQDEVSTVFRLGATLINLLAVSAAGELVEPVAVIPAGGAAQMLLSLWVDDVDATCADLDRRGVTLINGPLDRHWGKRTAAFADPNGTVWEIAQDIPVPTQDASAPRT